MLCRKIVDSIMALFRVDFSGRGELSERQQKVMYTMFSFRITYLLPSQLAQVRSGVVFSHAITTQATADALQAVQTL
jgi:Rad51